MASFWSPVPYSPGTFQGGRVVLSYPKPSQEIHGIFFGVKMGCVSLQYDRFLSFRGPTFPLPSMIFFGFYVSINTHYIYIGLIFFGFPNWGSLGSGTSNYPHLSDTTRSKSPMEFEVQRRKPRQRGPTHQTPPIPVGEIHGGSVCCFGSCHKLTQNKPTK